MILCPCSKRCIFLFCAPFMFVSCMQSTKKASWQSRCSPVSRQEEKKCILWTNQAGAYRMQTYLFPSPSNSNSLHMSKSQLCSNFSACAYTHSLPCAHAPGSRDSAAELITRNGSIRRSVMINPVESLLLRSVTCRVAPPPAAPPALTVRTSTWWPAQGHSEAA